MSVIVTQASDLDGINPEQVAEAIRTVANLTGEQLRGIIRWADERQDLTVFEQAVYISDHRRENGYGLPADWLAWRRLARQPARSVRVEPVPDTAAMAER